MLCAAECLKLRKFRGSAKRSGLVSCWSWRKVLVARMATVTNAVIAATAFGRSGTRSRGERSLPYRGRFEVKTSLPA